MRALILIAGLAAVATAQQKDFTSWPAGASPQEVGKKPRTLRGMPRWNSPK